LTGRRLALRGSVVRTFLPRDSERIARAQIEHRQAHPLAGRHAEAARGAVVVQLNGSVSATFMAMASRLRNH
jgi:hypothetical protein